MMGGWMDVGSCCCRKVADEYVPRTVVLRKDGGTFGFLLCGTTCEQSLFCKTYTLKQLSRSYAVIIVACITGEQ